MNSVGGRLDLRKLFSFKVFFSWERDRERKRSRPTVRWSLFHSGKDSASWSVHVRSCFSLRMTKTFTLSRKCKYGAKIFAGIIPLTPIPVDSGAAQAENFPPSTCLFFFSCTYIFLYSTPLSSHQVSAFELQFSACLAMSEVCSLLIEQIRWRPLGCSREGVSLCKELDHGGNKSAFP